MESPSQMVVKLFYDSVIPSMCVCVCVCINDVCIIYMCVYISYTYIIYVHICIYIYIKYYYHSSPAGRMGMGRMPLEFHYNLMILVI